MIFGINTTSDISKLLYIIRSGIYAKYHVQIMLLFVYTTTHTRFVIFTYRYFKLIRNTTALSQSNCRNFSCSSITYVMCFSYANFQRSQKRHRYQLHWDTLFQECFWSRSINSRVGFYRGAEWLYTPIKPFRSCIKHYLFHRSKL